jgi:hypothetical protein
MILMGKTSRLSIDTQLNNLTHVVNDQVDLEDLTLHMIIKMKLIIKLHESLLENVDHAYEKQKQTYATRKGRIMFHSFEETEVYVKMRNQERRSHC